MRSQRTLLTLVVVLAAAVVCCAGTMAISNLPPVQERFGWRISEARARVWYAIFPPERGVFTPDPTLAAAVQATLTAVVPTPTPTPPATAALPPTPSETPAPTATPLPASVALSGVRHEFQKWNNCGPATLAMALSFWGWDGDQRPVAAYTKPNPRDKNVMPEELADFVNTQTDLRAVVRPDGDLDLLKSFLAAGFPVMVEKGFEGYGFPGWMGHYAVVTGYDDARERFTTQDSYIGPDFPFPYADMENYWRDFNNVFLVVYPPDREDEVMALLGPLADETDAYTAAAQRASNEIYQLAGRDQLFAWFNRGTNLAKLQDYGGAAAAYDEAFQINAELAVSDPDHFPWRLLWYQTGPYKAYYGTGRYQEVINLATRTLDIPEPVLEESYYWRGLAWDALGDRPRAIADMRSAVEVHPGFDPALFYLRDWGVEP
jgi:hypothetical protein